MPQRFRPMLAASLPTGDDSDLKKMNWERGFLASPKMDGIRAVIHPDLGPISRTLKPIPNRFIREALSQTLFSCFDGELILGRLEDQVDYNTNQSGIMSSGGSPFFTYCVFDDMSRMDVQFWWRNNQAKERIAALNSLANYQGMFDIMHLPQVLVHNVDELLRFEEECLRNGFEGVIFRDPGCGYKNNRSTFKQQGMTKLKRFTDAEAIIIGFEELFRNGNEPTIDARGYQIRSAHLANQIPAGTLGKIIVRGINGRWTDTVFSIGSGFDDSLRAEIWNNQLKYLERIVKYKFQSHGGKDRPRSPIFLGFRSVEDI